MTYRRKKKNKRFRGVEYKSDLEVNIRKGLERLRRNIRANFKIRYESETLDYVIRKKYSPDFIIEREDGSLLYIEVKGYFDRDAVVKMNAVIEQHPDKEIVFVFQNDRPIRKGAKKKYSDWCRERGVDFAINEIPERWFNRD